MKSNIVNTGHILGTTYMAPHTKGDKVYVETYTIYTETCRLVAFGATARTLLLKIVNNKKDVTCVCASSRYTHHTIANIVSAGALTRKTPVIINGVFNSNKEAQHSLKNGPYGRLLFKINKHREIL